MYRRAGKPSSETIKYVPANGKRNERRKTVGRQQKQTTEKTTKTAKKKEEEKKRKKKERKKKRNEKTEKKTLETVLIFLFFFWAQVSELFLRGCFFFEKKWRISQQKQERTGNAANFSNRNNLTQKHVNRTIVGSRLRREDRKRRQEARSASTTKNKRWRCWVA